MASLPFLRVKTLLFFEELLDHFLFLLVKNGK